MTDADHLAPTTADSALAPLQVGPLLATLERHGIAHVVIGGVAAQLHGSTHPTRAVDITANPYGVNLERLRAALVDLDAREYVPGFGYPLQLPMDRRRLSTDVPLRTVTRLGSLDIVPKPHGTDGYHELNRRSRYRHAYGLMVPVADLDDLMRSHSAAGRAKDGPIRTRLQDLRGLVRDRGIQPVFEQTPLDIGQPPELRAPAAQERQIHAALDAAAALAVVFDDIRPALAAARRQLYHALDDTDYGEGATVMRHIQVARNAVDAALTELVGLRRQLEPDATSERDLAEPPPLRGRTDSPTVLAYQAYDETSVTRRLLANVDSLSVKSADNRDLLIEARIHAATADANLDLLQIQLERTARAWELPEPGREIPGPEL